MDSNRVLSWTEKLRRVSLSSGGGGRRNLQSENESVAVADQSLWAFELVCISAIRNIFSHLISTMIRCFVLAYLFALASKNTILEWFAPLLITTDKNRKSRQAKTSLLVWHKPVMRCDWVTKVLRVEFINTFGNLAVTNLSAFLFI